MSFSYKLIKIAGIFIKVRKTVINQSRNSYQKNLVDPNKQTSWKNPSYYRILTSQSKH